MQISIAGGGGFVGCSLSQALLQAGHQVTVLSRDPAKVKNVDALYWDGKTLSLPDRPDIIINLCGKGIAEQRWTSPVKAKLFSSRLHPTRAIINYIEQFDAGQRPRLINASAVGFYSSANEEQTEVQHAAIDEKAVTYKLISQWEAAARSVDAICLRFGVVLGRDGGMLKKVFLSYKLGLGSVIGEKNNFLSWIHIQDLCRAILFILDLQEPKSTYNLTAPNPCTQQQFSKTLAATCHRPCFLNLPAFMVNALFGEMGKELFLINHKVLPRHLLEAGFEFKYPDSESALQDLLV